MGISRFKMTANSTNTLAFLLLRGEPVRPEKGAAEMPLAAAVRDLGFYNEEWGVFMRVAL